MFSKKELKELAGYQSETSPVLSIYLDVDSTRLTADQYRLTLRGMLKSVADKAAREDIERVEAYFDFEYDHQGNGVAIFSAQDFWRAFPLAVSVGNDVHVSAQPYIKPLADFFEAYDRYGVVLVDREGARLFMFSQGLLQEATGMLGDEIKEQLRGASGRGGRSGTGSGHGRTSGLDHRIEQIAARNLRDVVELTRKFYQAGKCERIILGGTDENRARFLSMLPKPLSEKVIGDITIDMYASAAQVLERSMEIIQASVAERKAALVQALITAAHKDSGSLGLADTLLAMQERRVQTLVVSEGFSEQGYVCTHCHYATLRQTGTCPPCGGPVERVDDIVDYLVHRALELDVEVVFAQDEALEQAGMIGALWRF
jgi:peptide subunit release factor 1 (eRF1)